MRILTWYWDSGLSLSRTEGEYLHSMVYLDNLGGTRRMLFLWAGALKFVLSILLERMFLVAYHGRMKGALPALEEQYHAVSERLSHVYCFIMNVGNHHALANYYSLTLLDGLPNSRRTSLRPFAQQGTQGVLTHKGKPMYAFYIQLFTGEPFEGYSPAMTNADHRKFMDVLTMEKVPVGMPLEYSTRIGIPELNRCQRRHDTYRRERKGSWQSCDR
jgi:hypothetical protein